MPCLPQRLAQNHGGGHRHIERTQSRPHGNDKSRLRGLMHLVGNACGFAPDENDVVRAEGEIRVGHGALGGGKDKATASG